jgi:hypothetical protein
MHIIILHVPQGRAIMPILASKRTILGMKMAMGYELRLQ